MCERAGGCLCVCGMHMCVRGGVASVCVCMHMWYACVREGCIFCVCMCVRASKPRRLKREGGGIQ